MLIYENTILNKLIVTFTTPFCNYDNKDLVTFDNCDDLSEILEIHAKDVNYHEVYILISSEINTDFIFKNCQPEFSGDIFIICKNIEYLENFNISNWHIYWTNAMTEIHKMSDIDREIINNLNYSYPVLTQRRLNEYLTVHCSTPKERFISLLSNETLSMMLNRGRHIIESKQLEIDRDKEGSKTKIINGKRYCFCISHHVETAYQIIERNNTEIVLLFNINLKKSLVNVSCVTATNVKSIFEDKIMYKTNNISKLKITFQEFLDILE
jgi:DNA-binding Lrp family transcriptional regulator